MFDTQRILFSPANDSTEFANAQWADTIPRLLQARLIQSFENYDIAHAPLRSADGAEADYQLLIDIREFQVAAGTQPAAKIAFSARLLTSRARSLPPGCSARTRPSTRSNHQRWSPRSTPHSPA